MDEKKRIKVRVNDPNLPHVKRGFPPEFESPVLVVYPFVTQASNSRVIANQKQISIELKTLLLVVDPELHFQWIDSMYATYIEGEFIG